MSRAEQVMRARVCDRCGALPGERCVSKTGRALSYSHAPRFDAATLAGDLPLPDDGKPE